MSRIYKVLLVSFFLLLSTQTIFAGRYFDSATGRWLSVDPKAINILDGVLIIIA